MFDLLIHNAKIITLDKIGTMEKGYLLIHQGKIITVESGNPDNLECCQQIDAEGRILMPALVDCHTHLMEYATAEIHQTQGQAQKMAGIANLLTALKAGITAIGEHHLGHPVLSQESLVYKDIVENLPIDVSLASGCCFIGTDPLILVSSTEPGRVLDKRALSPEDYRQMALMSDFPGENIFLNATVANLPLSAAPRAGEITFTKEELKEIVGIFHACNKRIGAHIEGDEAAMMFIEAGGDVIHHGHGISPEVAELMAAKGIPLVLTPHGGTGSRPTSPAEALAYYRRGIKIALASDAYLPVHSEADWINLPPGHLSGPEDFLAIAHPILDYFLKQGIALEETLKLITLNGREILSPHAPSGALKSGNKADLILCDRIPAVETTDVKDIKCVIKDGQIVISRL